MKDPIIIVNTPIVADTFHFGGVTIKGGKVTVPEGVDLDEASLAFWAAVERYGNFDKADRQLIADGSKPICDLVWEQGYFSPDDVFDMYRVAGKGDKCVDGSPPFPVWGSPNFFAKLDIAEKALEKIKTWIGEFPETGKFWDDNPDRPISYGAQFGSNGERDYMRAVAGDALQAIKGNTKS